MDHHSPSKLWAGALSALIALFAAVAVATPAWATVATQKPNSGGAEASGTSIERAFNAINADAEDTPGTFADPWVITVSDGETQDAPAKLNAPGAFVKLTMTGSNSLTIDSTADAITVENGTLILDIPTGETFTTAAATYLVNVTGGTVDVLGSSAGTISSTLASTGNLFNVESGTLNLGSGNEEDGVTAGAVNTFNTQSNTPAAVVASGGTVNVYGMNASTTDLTTTNGGITLNGSANLNVYVAGAAANAKVGNIDNTGTGTVTINGGTVGTLENSSTGKVNVTAPGTLTSIGGTVENSANGEFTISGGNFNNNTVENSSGGKLTVTGSPTGITSISNTGGGSTTIGSAAEAEAQTPAITCPVSASQGSLFVNSGDFTAAATVETSSTANMTINDGTFAGTVTNGGSGKATINGGDFSVAVSNASTGTMNVSGGTFSEGITNQADGTVSITSGTFTNGSIPDEELFATPSSIYGVELANGRYILFSGDNAKNNAASAAEENGDAEYGLVTITKATEQDESDGVIGTMIQDALPTSKSANFTAIGFLGWSQNTASEPGKGNYATYTAPAVAWDIVEALNNANAETATVDSIWQSSAPNPAPASANVMWAVFTGTPETPYGVAFSRAGANGSSIAFNTGGNEGGQDNAVVTTDANGVGCVWFVVNSDPGQSSLPSLENAGVEDVPNTLSGTYQATAWASGQYTDIPLGKSAEITVSGVTFTNGSDQNVSLPMYGVVDSDITLPGEGRMIAPAANLALSGWAYGGTTYPANTTYELPEPTSAGVNITMAAQWGAPVVLHMTVGANFLTGEGLAFYNAEGKPINNGGSNTLTIGATSDGKLPVLPILSWNNSTGPNANGEHNWDAGVFVGWYTYSAASGYQLWQAGDSVTDIPDGGLYPLFAQATIDWEPAITADTDQLVGTEATYTATVELDTDNIPVVEGASVPGTSTAATDFFWSQVEDELTEAVEAASATTSLTGLQNVRITLYTASAENVDPGTTTPLNPSRATGVTVTVGDYADGALPVTVSIATETNVGSFTLSANVQDENEDNGTSLYTGLDTTSLPVDVKGLLIVNISPNDGAGTVSQKVNADGTVTLTATPAEGWHFVQWNNAANNVVSTNPVLTVPYGNTYYTAVFEQGSSGELPSGEVPVYRVYNPFSHEHLYTVDKTEYDYLVEIGWDDEGIAWNAPGASIVPVYRLFNPYSLDHYYTTNRTEAADLVGLGWEYDFEGGPAFYGAVDSDIPIYQLFNPYETTNTHLWTADLNEYTELGQRGWQQEGPKWDAISMPV